ncbi:MAG TPA: hypothetical protein EYP10_07860 [Armatimonadetes bacterium]|nr:hypothetical protein [Armatimonadota bacterium]
MSNYRRMVLLDKRIRRQVERHRWDLLRRALPSLRSAPRGAWRRHLRRVVFQPRVELSLVWDYLTRRR